MPVPLTLFLQLVYRGMTTEIGVGDTIAPSTTHQINFWYKMKGSSMKHSFVTQTARMTCATLAVATTVLTASGGLFSSTPNTPVISCRVESERTVQAFEQTGCGRAIPILRTISNPDFSYTFNSKNPLFIEIREVEIFNQLGLKNQNVDFSTEEVLIFGFNERIVGGNFQIKGLSQCQGKIVVDKEVVNFNRAMTYNDCGDYPLVTIVIPRQKKALPGFQTALPLNGGFYSQGYYYANVGNIDVDDIKRKIKSAGIKREGDDRFYRFSSRRYEVVSYVHFSGQKLPQDISFFYPRENRGIHIGPTTSSTFSDWGIKLPEMESEQAAKHLSRSLILPLFDVSEKEALVFAAECIQKRGGITFRTDWPMPERFNEERFRAVNGLPQKSDFSIFRRSDVNDSYNTFTESSSQAHLRIHLAHVSFRRRVAGIGEYIIHIAEYGRMCVEIVNLEKPLTTDELWQGFEKALQGLVESTPDRKGFHPIYGYSDSGARR